MSHKSAVEAIRIDVVERRAAAAAKLNASGIRPKDTKCLVLPDPVETKSAGGLLLPDEVIEKMAWKRQRCTLLACGASAFAEWLDAPKPGDRVFVSQYSGAKIEADDGMTYWIINDEDVIGEIVT